MDDFAVKILWGFFVTSFRVDHPIGDLLKGAAVP